MYQDRTAAPRSGWTAALHMSARFMPGQTCAFCIRARAWFDVRCAARLRPDAARRHTAPSIGHRRWRPGLAALFSLDGKTAEGWLDPVASAAAHLGWCSARCGATAETGWRCGAPSAPVHHPARRRPRHRPAPAGGRVAPQWPRVPRRAPVHRRRPRSVRLSPQPRAQDADRGPQRPRVRALQFAEARRGARRPARARVDRSLLVRSSLRRLVRARAATRDLRAGAMLDRTASLVAPPDRMEATRPDRCRHGPRLGLIRAARWPGLMLRRRLPGPPSCRRRRPGRRWGGSGRPDSLGRGGREIPSWPGLLR